MMTTRPSLLRCEHLVNPLGIDIDRPRLSWLIESYGITRRGAAQSAYQILAASDPSLLAPGEADLWDTGRITSSITIEIEYDGRPLRSGERAFWTVLVWDEQGEPAAQGPFGWWEAGLLDRTDWAGEWLSALRAGESVIRGAHLRRGFQLDKPVRRARLYASALGCYVPFINGQRVGHDYFRPGWTDYTKRVQYQTYDVTDLLAVGQNAVGLTLGDGWYCGEVGWVSGPAGGREHYGNVPKVLAQLHVEFDDGSTTIIATDKSWRCEAGGIITSDFLVGETYDARTEIRGWNQSAFDDSSWRPVKTHPLGNVPLVARAGPAVRQVAELYPIATSYSTGGKYIFDLGQNMVGWVRLKVRGPAGATVILRFAEMLNSDGTLYTENLRRARSTDQYTLRGDGDEVYEPSFTFHGFRYVEISGYPGGKPPSNAITGIVISSDTPAVGSFECSNPMVNQLQRNIEWGQRGNFLEVPTDCPQRDERLGWMGDAQIFVRTASFNSDVSAFFDKWMVDVVDAQLPDGAFSNVSPRIVSLSEGAPAWADAGIIVPWTIYQVYGDVAILKKHYAAMKKAIDRLHRLNPDALWTHARGNNFGDWLSINADTPKDVLASAYLTHSTRLLSRIAGVIGRGDDADWYAAVADKGREAFNVAYVSSDGRIQGDTQTAYVLALAFNLLPQRMRALATQHLTADIEAKHVHLSTGFLGVGHLLPVLTSVGGLSEAFSLLTKDTFPSWGYSIRHGATTIWERWDGWTSDKDFQDPGMNSFNHYALGSVGEWLYRTVAGIDLDEARPAYKHIILRPRPGGGLTYARASFDSVHGQIQSSWRIDGRSFYWDITIPPNTTATIHVPAMPGEPIMEGDAPAELSEGLSELHFEDDAAVFTAESGRYSFRVSPA